ncbi:HCLS1-associated protein X-1 isoform X2 [Cynoglossus semilaevis]|nr:HCLS1-associated protein X-1 isoform X2 [Cynoglossus semilaevis]
MSVFDLFRGFFGVPGGHRHGRRDPFFDTMIHEEEEEEEEEDDGFFYDGYQGDPQDPFDGAWRFGFSMGPNGMRIQEPPVFGQIIKEMEEIFSQMGHWNKNPESGLFGSPSIMPPSSQDRGEDVGSEGSSGNPLRDFMLKEPQPGPSREPRHDGFPFSKFPDIWRRGVVKSPEDEQKEDRDLDSAVSSGGLDQILAPPAGQEPPQPRMRSFFQSVSVTKVVKPDGTVEERRTVRDGQGNEETTVTRSGPGSLEGPDSQRGPVLPG